MYKRRVMSLKIQFRRSKFSFLSSFIYSNYLIACRITWTPSVENLLLSATQSSLLRTNWDSLVVRVVHSKKWTFRQEKKGMSLFSIGQLFYSSKSNNNSRLSIIDVMWVYLRHIMSSTVESSNCKRVKNCQNSLLLLVLNLR